MRKALAAMAGMGALALSLFSGGGAMAQHTSDPCMGLVSSNGARVHRAALGAGEIGITFVGHATFLLESPGGIRIATDYNDYVRPADVPDVATMNHAHTTHYSNNPDPRIPHVLKGWNPAGGPARHDLAVGDVRVRNVPTSIRDWAAARSATATRSSSSRWRGFASPISDTCTTRCCRPISSCSDTSTFCWCRSTAATRWTGKACSR